MIRAPATIPTIPGLQTALNSKLSLAGGTVTGVLTVNASTLNISSGATIHQTIGYAGNTYYSKSVVLYWETGASVTGAADLMLLRDAAGVLGLRLYSGAAASLRVYGSYTGAGANYARASLSSSSTDITLSAEAGGTAGPNLHLKLIPAGTGKVSVSAALTLKGYTVATLPAGTIGDTAFVTDSAAPTFLSAVAGGGSVVTKVFFNGTSWICQ